MTNTVVTMGAMRKLCVRGRWIVVTLITVIALYTRMGYLGWGLPYPMHPDERNMAVALQQYQCDLKRVSDCFNPHFFAYGQLPLNVAYVGLAAYRFLLGGAGPITYNEAVSSLRILSSLASLGLIVAIMATISELRSSRKRKHTDVSYLTTLLIMVFVPFFMQAARFGTTESLIMLFVGLISYASIRFYQRHMSYSEYVFTSGILCGLSMGTKVSIAPMLVVPFVLLIMRGLTEKDGKKWQLGYLVSFFFITALFFVTASPQSFMHMDDWIASLRYESSVALGEYIPFYTRQFAYAPPVLFYVQHILPYAIGTPLALLGLAGSIFLPPTGPLLIIRVLYLVLTVPSLFVYAKWTRFPSPGFPPLIILAVSFFLHYKEVWKSVSRKRHIPQRFTQLVTGFVLLILLLPGIAFMGVYQQKDVRFRASEWVYSHVPEGSLILSETANVIDVPIPPPHSMIPVKQYSIVSFNFYDLDQSKALQEELSYALDRADYIIVPSRRIYANHTCLIPNSKEPQFPSSYCASLKNTYPRLNSYYTGLFSGELGFKQVAEFSSYPRIAIGPFVLLSFPDEFAEETWSVFDHPVIRIYQKIPPQEDGSVLLPSEKRTVTLNGKRFSVLVARTETEHQRGLMYVTSRSQLAGADGMMFIFPSAERRTFWNRNTYVDLDVYWMKKGILFGSAVLPRISQGSPPTLLESPQEVDGVVEIVRETQ